VWKHVAHSIIGNFFVCDIVDWVCSNLNNGRVGPNGVEWHTLFPIMLSSVWRGQNEMIFNGWSLMPPL